MKVFWQDHGKEEATWELEETMRAQYPQLFDSGKNFEDEIILREGELQYPKLYLESFITCLGYNKSATPQFPRVEILDFFFPEGGGGGGFFHFEKAGLVLSFHHLQKS